MGREKERERKRERERERLEEVFKKNTYIIGRKYDLLEDDNGVEDENGEVGQELDHHQLDKKVHKLNTCSSSCVSFISITDGTSHVSCCL